MFSLYLSRKKQEEAARAEAAQALDRAIHSEAHKRQTAHLSAQYHARVEEWMERTLAAPVPPLLPKPISQAAIDAAPSQFYRAPNLDATFRGPGSLGRGGEGGYGAPALPEHVQMSPRRYQTEAERLAAYEASAAHLQRVGHDPYADPLPYEYRRRAKGAELSGPFVYRPQSERARVEEALTARNLGGSTGPFEEAKQHPLYRTEQRDKWQGGHFSARLPSLPVFSRPEPYAAAQEPYAAPPSLEHVFRVVDPNATLSASTPRFTARVPSDRFVPSPRRSARSPVPPVQGPADPRMQLTHSLGAGLTSSGIYAPSFELDLARVPGYSGGRSVAGSASASARLPRRRGGVGAGSAAAAEPHTSADPTAQTGSGPHVAKTYWKTATNLAHQPGAGPVSSGSHTARAAAAAAEQAAATEARRDAETAQQLYKTYRRHLNY